eukprot:1157529-Pelagomonas_calceolata.AAC.2
MGGATHIRAPEHAPAAAPRHGRFPCQLLTTCHLIFDVASRSNPKKRELQSGTSSEEAAIAL